VLEWAENDSLLRTTNITLLLMEGVTIAIVNMCWSDNLRDRMKLEMLAPPGIPYNLVLLLAV
jgi:hypothetical protein